MKLWRRLAKKVPTGEFTSVLNVQTGEVIGKEEIYKRTGRQIRYEYFIGEQLSKNQPKTYPLLESLFKRAGMTYTLSKKQQEALKKMAAEAVAQEETNEAK